MFNVTIINGKKSLIRISILIITIILLFLITELQNSFKTNEILEINISEKLTKCLSYEVPAMESTYYQANNIIKKMEKKK